MAKVKYGRLAGTWYGYEVKTSQNGSPRPLSDLQKEGADAFMSKRIDAMTDKVGRYTTGRVNAQDTEMARLIQSDQKSRPYHGDVVQITFFGDSKKVNASFSPWLSPADALIQKQSSTTHPPRGRK